MAWVRTALLGLPKLPVSLGTIGMTINEVASAAANQGPKMVSLVPYILLNQSESNCIPRPDAKPINPILTENFAICKLDLECSKLFEFILVEASLVTRLSLIGKIAKPERIERKAKIRNVYSNDDPKFTRSWVRKRYGSTLIAEPTVSAMVHMP